MSVGSFMLLLISANITLSAMLGGVDSSLPCNLGVDSGTQSSCQGDPEMTSGIPIAHGLHSCVVHGYHSVNPDGLIEFPECLDAF